MGIADLQIKLSGGAGNTDPAASTGGVKSTLAVLSQSATLTAIPGVAVFDAAGNTVGSGTLAYAYTPLKTLTYTPPGGIAGTAVNIGANGRYRIQGSGTDSGYVIVDVISASLSTGTAYSRAVTIASQSELFLPAVDKDTAFAGATQYFLHYLDNTGATTIKSVQVQIQTDTPGLDTLSLSNVAAKNTAEVQGDAAGHTYSAVAVNVTLGDLLTTDYWGVWIKRVIPSGLVDGVTANTFRLKITSLT